MTRTTLFVAIVVVLQSLLAAHAQARQLLRRTLDEDEHNSQSNDVDNYNQYINNNNGDGSFFTSAKQRFENDINNMWTSSPSEWVAEYWEVFAIGAAIAFGIGFLFCCLFCIIPCFIDAPAERPALTPQEWEERQEHKRQMKANNPDVQPNPSLIKELSTRINSHRGRKTASDSTVTTEPISNNNIKDDGDGNKSKSNKKEVHNEQIQPSNSTIKPQDKASRLGDNVEREGQGGNFAACSAMDPIIDSLGKDDDESIMSQSVFSKFTARSGRSRRTIKQNMSRQDEIKELMDDVVDVWREFLGFKNEKEYDTGAARSSSATRYRRYEDDQGVPRRGRSVRKKRTSSKKMRTSPSKSKRNSDEEGG